MKALSDFFTSDYGLMSAAVIALTLFMGGYFTWYFVGHMKADERKQAAARR